MGIRQQGGGAVSLNMQSVPDSGGRTKLLVENSDIIGTDVRGSGTTRHERLEKLGGDGHAVIVDFGGGALGSLGNNRFIGNEKGAMRVPQNRITAANNWWDGGEPTVYNSQNQPSGDTHVLVEPVLGADPR